MVCGAGRGKLNALLRSQEATRIGSVQCKPRHAIGICRDQRARTALGRSFGDVGKLPNPVMMRPAGNPRAIRGVRQVAPAREVTDQAVAAECAVYGTFRGLVPYTAHSSWSYTTHSADLGRIRPLAAGLSYRGRQCIIPNSH